MVVAEEDRRTGVGVVRLRLRFDELDEVATRVIEDGHDSGSDVSRRLGERHVLADQTGVLGLDVAHGELSEWDAVLDKRIPARLHSRVWSDGSSSISGPLGDSGDTTVSQKSLPRGTSRRFVKPSASV